MMTLTETFTCTAALKTITIYLLLHFYAQCEHLKILKLSSPLICQGPQPNQPTTIGLGNCENNLYMIKLGVGTPPQYLLYQFDTGSNIFWTSTSQSILKPGFLPAQSSSYQITTTPYKIEYADQSQISGFMGSDIVSLSSTSINVTDSILFASNSSKMKTLFELGISGVAGMGYTSFPNFLDLAYAAAQIKTNVFALELVSNENGTASSSLYYNQIPEHILNGTLYSRVYGAGFWQLNLIGVYANENDLTQYAENVAVIDSGTSLFYLNSNLYSAFSSTYLSSCQQKNNDGFICPCATVPLESLPNIYFMFPGVEIAITASSYYSMYNVQADECLAQIQSFASTDYEVLLGDTLFREYVITFDKNEGRIGFYGQNMREVPVFGNRFSFMTSQFVMLGFNIGWLIWGLALFYCSRSKLPKEEAPAENQMKVIQ